MKVFLSWSGESSKAIASALKDWLQKIFPTVDFWMSSRDLPLGTPWAERILAALDGVQIGILVLCKETLSSPWVIFEAGALAKSIPKTDQTSGSFVIPLFVDFSVSHLEGPLSVFQGTPADKGGMWRIVRELAAHLKEHRDQQQLEKLFDSLWPDLDQSMRAALEQSAAFVGSSMQDMVERLSVMVRSMLTASSDNLPLERDAGGTPKFKLVKLIGRPQLLEKAGFRGGGAYFDFGREQHEYGQGSDIKLESDSFRTGFAGADYGFILPVGSLPLSAVSSNPHSPVGLNSSVAKAWNFLWTYVPPSLEPEVRIHQRDSLNWKGDGFTLSRKAVANVGETYLLRSISFRHHDILVAFKVIEQGNDKSLFLEWSVLNRFPVPELITA